jgi:hypothetical protein
MRELMRRALAVFVAAGQTVASARIVVCILIVSGSACAVLGVFLIGGTPPALLAASVICFALAFLILRGLDPNV